MSIRHKKVIENLKKKSKILLCHGFAETRLFLSLSRCTACLHVQKINAVKTAPTCQILATPSQNSVQKIGGHMSNYFRFRISDVMRDVTDHTAKRSDWLKIKYHADDASKGCKFVQACAPFLILFHFIPSFGSVSLSI